MWSQFSKGKLTEARNGACGDAEWHMMNPAHLWWQGDLWGGILGLFITWRKTEWKATMVQQWAAKHLTQGLSNWGGYCNENWLYLGNRGPAPVCNNAVLPIGIRHCRSTCGHIGGHTESTLKAVHMTWNVLISFTFQKEILINLNNRMKNELSYAIQRISNRAKIQFQVFLIHI